MKAPPLIPPSGRSRDDLDMLIDQSIGQKRKYDEAGGPHLREPPAPEHPTSSIATPQSTDNSQSGAVRAEPVDRFQVYLPREIITALKLQAVRQRQSPSAVLEIALRRYLEIGRGE